MTPTGAARAPMLGSGGADVRGPSGRPQPRSVGADSLRGLRSSMLREDVDSLGPGLALRWFADPPTAQFVLPPSDALAVVLVTRGTYLLESGKGHRRATALMRPGVSAVTAPGREVVAGWRSSSREPFQSLHLHVTADLLQRTADELGHSSTRPDYLHRGDARLAAGMRRLAAHVAAAAPRLQLDMQVQLLLHHLLSTDPRHDIRGEGGLPDRALRAVTDLMRERLDGPVALEELAGAAHLSPFHFLRRFRAATGETPLQYLARMRMDRAETLLTDTSRSVSDIANHCGYATPSAFSAAFTRVTGSSPTRFRRELRNPTTFA